jgi:hypothetical protein
MSNENDVQEIELSIETAQATVDRMKVFLRLVDNKDFQEIIEKGYFEDEAVRLVGALSSPALADEVSQGEMQKDIIGVGRLRQYFYAIVQQGRAAESAVKSNEAEIELLRAEGLTE